MYYDIYTGISPNDADSTQIHHMVILWTLQLYMVLALLEIEVNFEYQWGCHSIHGTGRRQGDLKSNSSGIQGSEQVGWVEN